MKTCIVALVAFLFLPIFAEPTGELRQGPFVTYYSVFNSVLVEADIAGLYGLVRGPDRGLFNVSVRRNLPSGENVSSSIKISGTATNLLGQKTELEFQEIVETGAVYYLAGFIFGNEDILKFSLELEYEDGSRQSIEFSHKLYLNP